MKKPPTFKPLHDKEGFAEIQSNADGSFPHIVVNCKNLSSEESVKLIWWLHKAAKFLQAGG